MLEPEDKSGREPGSGPWPAVKNTAASTDRDGVGEPREPREVVAERRRERALRMAMTDERSGLSSPSSQAPAPGLPIRGGRQLSLFTKAAPSSLFPDSDLFPEERFVSGDPES